VSVDLAHVLVRGDVVTDTVKPSLPDMVKAEFERLRKERDEALSACPGCHKPMGEHRFLHASFPDIFICEACFLPVAPLCRCRLCYDRGRQ
jgi:hypothetical protein